MKQQLYVFTKVVELKSFSKAAEELFMTQPAVSQYIRSLEESLGTKLLDRSNKVISLTKAGEIAYTKGKEILRLYSNMQHLIEDLTNQARGSISIGASYTFGEYILPHIIADMKKSYPSIKPSISIGNTKEIVELVKNNSLDLGVIEGAWDDYRTLTIQPFAKDVMYIVVSPQSDIMMGNEPVTIQTLQEATWIIRESGSGTREATEKLFQKLQINPVNKMEFGSTQVIKESVEAGLGITFLSKSSFRKEEALNTLQVIQGEEYSLTRHFSYVLKSSFQTKAVEVLIQLLKQYK